MHSLRNIYIKILPHKKKVIFGILLVIYFFIVATLSYLFFNFLESEAAEESKEVGPQTSPTSTSSSDPLAPYNILLLGYGGAGHPGSNLTDAMMVVYVNPKQKQVSLIGIPRDIWITIPTSSDKKEDHKINAAFAIGSDDAKYPYKEPQYRGENGEGEMAKYAVGLVLGMPVKNFIAINFDGFKEAIDILGNIEVDVPRAFDDYFYPVVGKENEPCGKSAKEIAALTATMSGFTLEKQFPCRYEHLHFDAGKQSIDGTMALKFARSRHSEQHGGDFARQERQQALLLGVKDKILSLNVISQATQFVKQFSHIIQTDIDEERIKQIIETHPNPLDFSVSTINLSEENVLKSTTTNDGQFILIPKEGSGKWEAVHSFIVEAIKSQD